MKKVLVVAAMIVTFAGLGAAQQQQGAAGKETKTKFVDKASPQLMLKEQGGRQPTPPRAGLAVSDEGSPAEPGSKPIKKPIKK